MKFIKYILFIGLLLLPCSMVATMQTTSDFVIADGVLIAYRGNKAHIEIPDEVKVIQEKAFYDMDFIKSVEMNHVEVIENQAFMHCEQLQDVHFSNQLTTLGSDAFAYTTALETLYLPSSLKQVGYPEVGIFGESGLKEVILGYDMAEIPYYLFKNAHQLKVVIMPSKLQKINDGAFMNCSSLAKVVLPNELTYLGDNVFYRCTSLYDIQLPKQLEYMGMDVFQGCSALTSIHIPKSLKRIALTSDGIFSESGLKEVSFDKDMTEIPQYLFKNASNLTKISFPPQLRRINDGAFYGCDGLTSIQLPKGFEHLRRHAFASCKNLKDVKGLNDLSYFDEKAFSESPSICLYIKKDSLVYQYALIKNWNYVYTGALNAPQNIKVERINETSVKLSWDDNELSEEYVVCYYRMPHYMEGKTIRTQENSVVIENLKDDGSYQFEVSIVIQDGFKTWESESTLVKYSLLLN